MPVYQYKARDKFGSLKDGVVKAESVELASLHIKEINLTLISLKEKKDEFGSRKSLFIRGIRKKDIGIFTRQLHTLLIAGLSVVGALKALETSASNILLQRLLKRVREEVEGGSSLSVAFGKFKKYFDDLYCNMVKAGEESGTLPEVLERLAFSIEKEEEIQRRIRQAMSYPIIVVVTMVLAVVILGVFVIPRFAKLFARLNAELPLPTKILVKTHYLLSHYWYFALMILIALIVVFRFVVRTKPGRYFWDQFKIRFIILGPLFLKIYMSRFSYMVATLISSGVSVIDTFDLTARTANNVVVSKAIENIREKVRQGRTIASAMKDEELFPELVIQMVNVGEDSGRVDELLDQVGGFYEKEADYVISNLTTLLEPLLLFSLAGVVLIMALGIFLPLWNLHSAFTG